VTDTISFSEEQGIATLTFDNPARRNALGAVELDAIEGALASLSADTRVLLVTSSDDRIFCAGADLNQILDGTLDGDRFQSVTNQIAALPIPTIAVLTGNVFGGGAELALSCDFRLAREGIVLRIPAAAIGLCYPVEGIERLTRRLGPVLARRVLVAAETFSAEQMLSLNMVNAVHSADALRAAAEEYAQSLLALAPMAVTSMLGSSKQMSWIRIMPAHWPRPAVILETFRRGFPRSEKSVPRSLKTSDPESVASTMLGLTQIQASLFVCP